MNFSKTEGIIWNLNQISDDSCIDYIINIQEVELVNTKQ